MIPTFDTRIIKKKLKLLAKERMARNISFSVVQPIPFKGTKTPDKATGFEAINTNELNIFYDQIWNRLYLGEAIRVPALIYQLNKVVPVQIISWYGKHKNDQYAASSMRNNLFNRLKGDLMKRYFGGPRGVVGGYAPYLITYSVKGTTISPKTKKPMIDWYIALVASKGDKYYGVTPRFVMNLARTNLEFMDKKGLAGWEQVLWNAENVEQRERYGPINPASITKNSLYYSYLKLLTELYPENLVKTLDIRKM